MKLSGSHLLSFGWLSQHRQKGIKRGSVTPFPGVRSRKSEVSFRLMSKRFGPLFFKGLNPGDLVRADFPFRGAMQAEGGKQILRDVLLLP
jgi:hypothetical protein